MPPAGLEPATCGLGIRRSILLSYEGRHFPAFRDFNQFPVEQSRLFYHRMAHGQLWLGMLRQSLFEALALARVVAWKIGRERRAPE